MVEPAEIAVEPTPLEAADLIPDRALRDRDSDEFDYVPIAERIADLASLSEAPVNIALFSPWGSGKSSLIALIEDSLARSKRGVKLIRYDAWRYGGDGLRRNFIAHAAKELHLPEEDPRYADFHRGLYQNQRRVTLSGPRVLRALRQARLAPLIVLAAFVALLALLLDVDSVLIGATISTFLLLVTALIDTGKVEVEQSKPSEDEEFFSRFTRLVEWATDDRSSPTGMAARIREGWHAMRTSLALRLGVYRARLWWASEINAEKIPRISYSRLVFFIDELDRCEPGDIVKTLKALRTFLDAEHCAFIVAADREVIEEALQEVEQSTPATPAAPYYSTGGAYLDKIFQHQLALPPLRGRRLTRFARDLVYQQLQGRTRSSFWCGLAADQDGETLDRTLYALIPSHVRSPRRVKVLLNHLVLTAKVAEARGIYAPNRAPELAKLVALRTEFPLFATDLVHEPRLPSFLIGLASPEAHQKERVEALLEKYSDDGVAPARYIEGSESVDLGSGEGSANTDGGDAGQMSATSQAELNAVAERHREELRRYLQRTAEVADPARDLLFLEPAGQIYGLDPELGDRIERDAPDIPLEILQELSGLDEETRRGAARLLCDLVHELDGPERYQAMTVLMGLAEGIDPLGSAARPVANALSTYRSAEELGEEHLVGALRIALDDETDPRIRSSLVRLLFADERLLADAQRVSVIAAWAKRLEQREFRQLQMAIAGFLATEGDQVLIAALEKLDEGQSLRLIDSEEIWGAVASYAAANDEETVIASFDRLQRAGLGRRTTPDLAFALQGRLLDLNLGWAYQVVHRHADEVLAAEKDKERVNVRVLRAWEQAPPPHWEEWNERLKR